MEQNLDKLVSNKKINLNGKSRIAGDGTALIFKSENFKEKDKGYKQPVISVIIPVLQEEKLLEETLLVYSGELKGKYHFEVIISDGGSKDRTLEIAGKYADKVVHHNKVRKQTIAEGRNKGAEVAEGSILVFINGDTIPENPEIFFEYIYNWSKIENDTFGRSALACTVTVNPKEKLLKDSIFYTLHNFYIRLLNSAGIGMGRGECQIVRTEIFKKVNGYNSQIAAGEDFDFYRRIAKIGKISFVRELVVYESPRRFRKFGYIKILFSWTINSLSVLFFGKSMSDEWEAVR